MISTVVEVHADRLVLSMPEDTQESQSLRQGDVVDLLPRPRRGRKRFPEGQLLREHTAIMPELVDDRAWLDAVPVGRERL
jgi:hypothetical protein